MKAYFFLLFAGAQLICRGQVPYRAGYRCVVRTDSGRIYKPGGGRLHFRPLEIDVWYPAAGTTVAAAGATVAAGAVIPGAPAIGDTVMRFSEFLGLLQQRANRFQDDTVYTDLTGSLARYLCTNMSMGDSNSPRLLQLPTHSYKEIPPARGKFPLLLYLCSYNGICWENLPLFEYLAGQGYVVASITSVGRYPGDMSTKPADLFEQVRDGLFSLQALSSAADVDSTKIGLIGYSWGGLAALVMAMQRPSIRALVSLDGSELHYYGESPDVDSDFDAIRRSPLFAPGAFHIPYAYLESGGKQAERPADSIFDILPTLASPTFYRRYRQARHEDYSCLPGLPAQLGLKTMGMLVVPSSRVAGIFFDRYLKDNASATLDPPLTAGADSDYPTVRGRP